MFFLPKNAEDMASTVLKGLGEFITVSGLVLLQNGRVKRDAVWTLFQAPSIAITVVVTHVFGETEPYVTCPQ